MAAGRHNLTRRALLGAAAGVPLAGFAARAEAETQGSAHQPNPFGLSSSKPCTSPAPEEGKAALRQAQEERSGDAAHARWTRALSAFRRAEAKLAAFRAYEGSLPAAARAFPACAPLEQRSGELESARLARLRTLLRAPAPDLPALALKIQLAIDDEIAFFSGGEACLAAVKADALWLCGGSTRDAKPAP